MFAALRRATRCVAAGHSGAGSWKLVEHRLQVVCFVLLSCSLAMAELSDLTAIARAALLGAAWCAAWVLLLAPQAAGRRLPVSVASPAGAGATGQTPSLEDLARRDRLTGLASSEAFHAWLAVMWDQGAGSKGGRLGLVLVGLDRFKAYNDFSGQAAADGCLKTVAVCLRDQLRGTTDLVARLEGDRFAVLLPAASEQVCADIAERLRLAVQRLELPHVGLGVGGLVSISAGAVSQAILPGAASDDLLRAAEAALRQAKSGGRDRVCIATVAAAAGVSHAIATG
jgi:diguanylate cyclase (GGDEF)-like protein